MNGAQQTTRQARPPPTGPTPPAPSSAPPAPPNNASVQPATVQQPPANRQPNGPVNGTHTNNNNQKGKKKSDPPVDPSQLYESLKNRIATLEEEEIHNEEEERRIGASQIINDVRDTLFTQTASPAEEAQSKVAGLGDNAVHQKYVELVRTT